MKKKKGKEPRDGRKREKGKKRKILRCAMGVYQLPMMNIVIMYCKPVLTKN